MAYFVRWKHCECCVVCGLALNAGAPCSYQLITTFHTQNLFRHQSCLGNRCQACHLLRWGADIPKTRGPTFVRQGQKRAAGLLFGASPVTSRGFMDKALEPLCDTPCWSIETLDIVSTIIRFVLPLTPMRQWGSRAPLELKLSAFRQHFHGYWSGGSCLHFHVLLVSLVSCYLFAPRFVGQWVLSPEEREHVKRPLGFPYPGEFRVLDPLIT